MVWGQLVLSLFCYVLLGWLFAWTPGWAEALQYNESQQKTAFILSRIALIVVTLTLTLSFAWNRGTMGWVKTLGWCYILSHVVVGVLLLVFGGDITLYVIWMVVVSVAWAGAFSLVAAKNQLLMSFIPLHAYVILGITLIVGFSLGWLVRLFNK